MEEDNDNASIVELYSTLLEQFNTKMNSIIVSSIHGHKDICFNTNHREILYALKEHFNIINKGDYAEFKTNIFGKSLVISRQKIPLKPHIKDILYHYHNFYFRRLLLIESHNLKINENINKLMLLNCRRSNYFPNIYAFKTNIFICDIKNLIISFLKPTINSYYEYRIEYNEIN